MTDIARERHALAAQGLDIEYREDWGAQEDYESDRAVTEPALGFFLHISVTRDDDTELPPGERARMRAIEAIGQDRFGIGISYNAAAYDTGRLYEGQPLTRRGAHTVNDKGIARYGREGRSLNGEYRALCLPQMVDDDVTDDQIDAAARWAAAQIRAGLAVKGARWDLHRTVAWKDCPGDAGAARLDELNRLTTYYEAHGLGPTATPIEEDEDMAIEIRAKGRAPRLLLGGVLVGYDDGSRRDRILAALAEAKVPVRGVELGLGDYDYVSAAALTDHDLVKVLEAASTRQTAEAWVDIEHLGKALAPTGGPGGGPGVLRELFAGIVRDALAQAR